MTPYFTILAVEIGYVLAAAVVTQGARHVVARVARVRTAAAIRKAIRALPEPLIEPVVTGYRDNVASAVDVEESAPGLVARWRAKRAAAYVHELERRAKIDS